MRTLACSLESELITKLSTIVMKSPPAITNNFHDYVIVIMFRECMSNKRTKGYKIDI